jgi:hypothetical protein
MSGVIVAPEKSIWVAALRSPVCHRSVENRPVIIDSKPATFMVITGFEVG